MMTEKTTAPTARNSPARWRRLPAAILCMALAAGFYLRAANLDQVQRFEGDQGRDYLVVMDWFQHGQWPLLGQRRSVGDYAIGPGWFYTIAPLIAASGFHPAAGALTVTLFALAAALLAWFWVRSTGGSEWAALVPPFVFLFSAEWIREDRLLWNPGVLPFGVIAMTILIHSIPRRPVPCLALMIMLAAILPQWHSTGILVVLAALPFAMIQVRRAKIPWRSLRRRDWLPWALAVFFAVEFLYAPPLIFELNPGPGNLRRYLSNTLLSGEAPSAPLADRAVGAMDFFIEQAALRNFDRPPAPSNPWLHALVGLLAASFVFTCAAARRSLGPSVLYLAALLPIFLAVAALKGSGFQAYYFIPVFAAPILLTGWMAGRLTTLGDGTSRTIRRASRVLGVAMLLVMLIPIALQAPRAWAVHRRGTNAQADRFMATRAIARFIAEDAAGRPFSLFLVEPGNFRAQFQYFLRRLGAPPENKDYETLAAIFGSDLGERVYVIARGRAARLPAVARGLLGPLEPPIQVEDALVYRIARGLIPEQAAWLEIVIRGGRLVIAASDRAMP